MKLVQEIIFSTKKVKNPSNNDKVKNMSSTVMKLK